MKFAESIFAIWSFQEIFPEFIFKMETLQKNIAEFILAIDYIYIDKNV